MEQQGDIEDSHRPKGDCRDTTHDTSDTSDPRPTNRIGLFLVGLLALVLALGLLLGLVARSHNNEVTSAKASASIESSSPSIAGSTMPSLSPSVSGRPMSNPSTSPTLSEAPSSTPSGGPSLSAAPSSSPSGGPSVSGMPSSEPSSQPSTSHSPTLSYGPTQSPSTSSAPTPTFIDPRCFTVATYNSIDWDVARIADGIESLAERSHFMGGIVRLVAHDFMDYDRTSSIPYGPDGCFDPSHPANKGLPEDIWCDDCPLTRVYNLKYRPNNIGRADFWIAAGNAVIRQTSINNTLDMRGSFRWGRRDQLSCPGSGDRVPAPTGCDATEAAMIERMGLTWRDAVALMGAHTLGRGDIRFSGHHGTWSNTNVTALVFDKRYFEAAHGNAWRPRANPGPTTNDFTTGKLTDGGNIRLMLKTDLCLTMDVRNVDTQPCCSRTDLFYPHVENDCPPQMSRCPLENMCPTQMRRCPMYPDFHPWMEAVEAFEEMRSSDWVTNQPFYSSFEDAWSKATSVGRIDGLRSLRESCDADDLFQ